jgi:uncharacterized protein YcbX
MSSARSPLARVSRIVRYPIKSMAGQAVRSTRIGWHGLQGDRRYAFVATNDRSGFPWITARDVPEFVTWVPTFEDEARPDQSPVLVRWGDAQARLIHEASVEKRVSELAGRPARLIHIWGGIFDAEEVSLISTHSIQAACADAGLPVSADRFRANIELESLDAASLNEERWLGYRLIFGDRQDSARVRVTRPDKRCQVVNINPLTGVSEPGLFESVAKSRKNVLGVYARAEAPGTVEVGDVVYLLRA